jgi:DNA (cytosine-5)-methyltransferase 1
LSGRIKTLDCSNRYGIAQPYLIKYRGTATAQSVNDPIGAVSTTGKHHALIEPYLVQTNHGNGKDKNGDGRRVRELAKPLPTVAGNRGEFGLCEPYIVAWDHTGGNGNCVSSTDKPLTTVTSKQRHGVCEPYLVKFYGNEREGHSVNQPLGTVTTKDRFGLCQPTVEINGETYLVDILFRMLQVGELALAQGFRRSYKFTGNKTETVRQIGNAVPRRLARAIVRAVLKRKDA